MHIFSVLRLGKCKQIKQTSHGEVRNTSTLLLKRKRAQAECEHGNAGPYTVAFESPFVARARSVNVMRFAMVKTRRKSTVSDTACLPCCREVIPKDEREIRAPGKREGGR